MEIISGVIKGATKVVIYGPEGIGKSYFASRFPNPLFIDTEGSTKHMNVNRLEKPSSWTMLKSQIEYVKKNPAICDTLVIDTADWAETLCVEELIAKAQVTSIEGFGYGKGYTYLAEEFGRFLNTLSDLIGLGINVVVVAHAQMRKFEQPDEMGAYDRWELKLQKKTAPLVKEWADMLLFFNYKTQVINVDGQGAQKGKNKVQGGKRVMYTTHHPCWDAKNRHDLLPELPLDYDEIGPLILTRGKPASSPSPTPAPEHLVAPTPAPKPEPQPNIPKALDDLMTVNGVTLEEIQSVVAQRGYYPQNTPIENYDPQFIDGVLVGAWDQVYAMILEARDIPF